jgi:hypothetical protein
MDALDGPHLGADRMSDSRSTALRELTTDQSALPEALDYSRNLLFVGPVRSGKTVAAQAVTDELNTIIYLVTDAETPNWHPHARHVGKAGDLPLMLAELQKLIERRAEIRRLAREADVRATMTMAALVLDGADFPERGSVTEEVLLRVLKATQSAAVRVYATTFSTKKVPEIYWPHFGVVRTAYPQPAEYFAEVSR